MAMRGQFWLAILAILALGCGTADVSARELAVTDSGGTTVNVSAPANHVAALWFAHNEVLCMLGAAAKIVATVDAPGTYPWLYRVCPALHKATFIKSGEFNVETLLVAQPDVVFMSASDGNLRPLRNAGIPTLALNFTDFASMQKVIGLTASVLGPEAQARARRYDDYLDSRLALVRGRTAHLPANERPRVLHINNFNPLLIDGGDTIINDWIEAAGGVNAAAEVKGNMKSVSIEQVLRWNPDVIIYGASARDGLKITDTSVWKNIAAVKNGRVVVNPSGAFLWDRYGAEEALQIQWAAKLLHPALFRDLDMNHAVRSFYHDFFGYTLGDTEIQQILSGLPPS